MRFTPPLAMILGLALIGCHSSPTLRGSDSGRGRPGAPHGVSRELQAKMNEVVLQWQSAFDQAKVDEQQAIEERLRALAVENFDPLVQDLRGPDIEARFISAMMLGFSRDTQAVPILVQALSDPIDKVRNNATLGLGLIGSKSTPVAPLVLLLDDTNPNVRASAGFALQRVLSRGDDRGALPRLLRAIEDQDPAARNEAVRAIAAIAKPEAVDTLIKRTLNDTYYLVRLNTAVALASIRDYRAIPPLIDALQDADPRVKKEVVYALQQITGQSFQFDPLQWKSWWRENQATLLPTAAPEPAAAPATLPPAEPAH